jgi:hypothetical protein
MNVDVSTSIVINCSRDVVSQYAANPDHAYTYDITEVIPACAFHDRRPAARERLVQSVESVDVERNSKHSVVVR